MGKVIATGQDKEYQFYLERLTEEHYFLTIEYKGMNPKGLLLKVVDKS